MVKAKSDASAARKPSFKSGLGLESVTDLSQFLSTDNARSHENQDPMELDLDLIDEDPHQPRTVFDETLLQDMATTILSRGVKNPISVHKHPTEDGRYIINDGARRFRASKLAGKQTIKAFIDSDFTKIDQIVVNAHHQPFTSREWAILIDQEQKKGKKKSEIADELGMSRSTITHLAALLRLPDPIAKIFNSGRFVDPTGLNELVVMWKTDPKKVEAWLDDETLEITRSAIRKFHRFAETRNKVSEMPTEEESYEKIPEGQGDLEKERKARKEPDASKLRKTIVQVQHKGRAAQLQLNRRPSAAGQAWLKYDDDGQEFEAVLAQVKLVAILEG